MSQFEKLMADLAQAGADQEVLTKALPADDGKDDKNIQAAAAEGGSDDGADASGAAAGDNDEDDKPMAKSFKFTLEDGTEVEAQDGMEMVKALSDRVTAVESDKESLTKALESTVAVIRGYAPLIKSLQDQIAKLGGEGRGRKAVVSVVEKPSAGESTMAKSQPEGMSHELFFAKAFEAQKAGRISGQEIAIAEAYLNKGQSIPEQIVARVMA